MSDNLFNVKDKIVVITGGLGQLGRQYSLALLDRGAKVAVIDLNIDENIIAEKFGERRNDKNLLF